MDKLGLDRTDVLDLEAKDKADVRLAPGSLPPPCLEVSVGISVGLNALALYSPGSLMIDVCLCRTLVSMFFFYSLIKWRSLPRTSVFSRNLLSLRAELGLSPAIIEASL